ncbi:TRAP transporter small permease [Anaerotignum lactatifermentans]|uniref:TRAP transporter small permease n=1 Tax=Anaerotignum lactatifermentans TaxID=160404 RepID=UPI00255CB12A|nr:TRAP transporter small permease [Anaerotignum lactatifermentans]
MKESINKGILKFEKINQAILKLEDFLLGYIIVFMAILLVLNVFFRSVLNNSLSFAEELGGFLMVVVTFWGISTAARFSKHINMNAIVDNVPKKIRKAMLVIISGFTSLVMFYMTSVFVRYAMDNMKVGRISTALELPMWILQSIVAVGVFLTAVQYLICFIRNLTTPDVYLGSEVKAGEGLALIYEAEFKEFVSEEMKAERKEEEADAP